MCMYSTQIISLLKGSGGNLATSTRQQQHSPRWWLQPPMLPAAAYCYPYSSGPGPAFAPACFEEELGQGHMCMRSPAGSGDRTCSHFVPVLRGDLAVQESHRHCGSLTSRLSA